MALARAAVLPNLPTPWTSSTPSQARACCCRPRWPSGWASN